MSGLKQSNLIFPLFKSVSNDEGGCLQATIAGLRSWQTARRVSGLLIDDHGGLARHENQQDENGGIEFRCNLPQLTLGLPAKVLLTRRAACGKCPTEAASTSLQASTPVASLRSVSAPAGNTCSRVLKTRHAACI